MGHEHTIGMGHISCIFLAGAPGRILSGVVGFRVWGWGWNPGMQVHGVRLDAIAGETTN